MLRKTVMPIPPASKTYGRLVSSGSRKLPFGCSTSASSPTRSSTSERLNAESRRRVQKPSRPRSLGEVTTEKWRRAPRSSSYGGSSKLTKKYCPGVNSTSSPSRSKTTSSVPFATSLFSATRARTLRAAHSERRQQHEDDGRDGQQSMESHDRHREVLLRRGAQSNVRATCRPLSPSQPHREHGKAEGGDNGKDREGDPGKRILIGDDIDDPEDQAAGREQEMAQDQRRPDPVAPLLLLAHSASFQPDRKQHEASACRDHPSDQRSPLH